MRLENQVLEKKMKKTLMSLAVITAIGFSGCGGGGSDTPTTSTTTDTTTTETTTTPTQASSKVDVSGSITSDTHWTADKVYRLNGRVVVTSGATLTIDPGTVIVGKAGTGASSSWLVIDKGAKINAEGTAAKHIVFTSETAYDGGAPDVGQWGSLVIIGNAAMDAQVEPYEVDPSFVPGTGVADDNSGVLKYVDILNSGITIEENKELNGLSLVGVGNGTTIENIRVINSDDDCVEVWGGTVNMSDIYVSNCTDDQFDVDDGYSGVVTNLSINQISGKSGIEMSGNTAVTFKNLFLLQNESADGAEGAIYFKKDGIGGHFEDAQIVVNSTSANGAIYSKGSFDAANTTFTNVLLTGSNATKFTGDSASGIEAAFDGGSGNQKAAPSKVDVSGSITSDTHWTADKVYRLNGRVVVTSGATLTIDPGTVIVGKAGTGASSSWLVIDKGAKINAEGTAAKHIVFTSETAYDGGAPDVGQWGSLVIIGNAAMDAQVEPYEVDPSFVPGTGVADDNSGVLKYVDILNSGITIEENKELNGLSLVGVGNGTTIENIRVINSDDDCVEVWGGTVNMSDIYVSNCTDDQFDVDDGYSGVVTNLSINQISGKSGIEMSGNTAVTFKNLFLLQNESADGAEGAIYFKKDGIGGHFEDAQIVVNSTSANGAIYSKGSFDAANTTFTNVLLTGSNATKFTGDSASGIEAAFDGGSGNVK